MTDPSPSPSIEDRLAALEKKVAALEAEPGKDRWDKFNILSQPILAIVLLVLGFAVKDSVDLALREQELEITSGTEMQTLITTLRKPDVKQNEAEGSALALAAFGRPAIPVLVNELQIGSNSSRIGASVALSLMARTHPEETCAALQAVLDRSQYGRQFQWKAHSAAIEALGKGGCRDAVPALRGYAQAVRDDQDSTLTAYAERVYTNPPPDLESLQQIREKLCETMALLTGSANWSEGIFSGPYVCAA